MKLQSLSRVALVFALTLAAGTARAAHHEPGEHAGATAWDQAKVTATADLLSKEVGDIYRVALTDKSQRNPAFSNNVYVIVEDIQQLDRFMKRLSRDLDQGKGREETAPLFDRILQLVRRLQSQRKHVDILGEVEDDIQTAYDHLVELGRYYDVEVPPRQAPVAAPPER